MMDLDEEVRLPGCNSTSDSRDLNQHWGRHSQGQGSDTTDMGAQGQLSSDIPIARGFPVAVVSDEPCDSDDQPPHQAGVQRDPGGREDPPGGREQGEPLSVSPLSSVTKAGTLPGIPCHHCHGDPRFTAVPSTGRGALGSELIGGVTSRGTRTHLGEPLLLTVHRPPQP